MGLDQQQLVVTTDAAGAGTVSTQRPVNGYVVELRNNGTAWGGTVDYTFTRDDGGTVLAVTDGQGPAVWYPGGSVFGLGTGQSFRGVPVVGYLTMTLAQGGASKAGTVTVTYEDC